MKGTYFKGKPVLVTGASGLVGTNLIPRLLEEGAKVRATIHKKKPVVIDDRVEYIEADLTSRSDCRKAVEGQKLIFMCAASTSGAATIDSTPMIHVTPNIIMYSLIMEAAYEAKIEKFLWLASTTGYPASGDRAVKEDEMFEGDPYEKYYFAGWTKRFTEVLSKMYGEKLRDRMTTIVLRPTNIYGPNDDFEFATSHVVPALIRRVIERWDPIEVWGTGNDARDMIYIDDMVDAMLLAMERVNDYSAYNIGLGKAYTIKEILGMILEIDGIPDAEVFYDESKPTMIPIRLVDVGKARTDLDFKPKVDLKEGLKRTIEWYRQARRG